MKTFDEAMHALLAPDPTDAEREAELDTHLDPLYCSDCGSRVLQGHNLARGVVVATCPSCTSEGGGLVIGSWKIGHDPVAVCDGKMPAAHHPRGDDDPDCVCGKPLSHLPYQLRPWLRRGTKGTTHGN